MKCFHVVCKTSGIDFYAAAGNHLYNFIFQTVIIHLNIYFQSFESLGLIPVVVENMIGQTFHHGFGAVYGRNPFKRIPVR